VCGKCSSRCLPPAVRSLRETRGRESRETRRRPVEIDPPLEKQASQQTSRRSARAHHLRTGLAICGRACRHTCREYKKMKRTMLAPLARIFRTLPSRPCERHPAILRGALSCALDKIPPRHTMRPIDANSMSRDHTASVNLGGDDLRDRQSTTLVVAWMSPPLSRRAGPLTPRGERHFPPPGNGVCPGLVVWL